MSDRLKDKVALVTGAGSGIGAATAKRLAEEGAAVIVTDHHVEHGTETANEIKANQFSAHFMQLDVTNESSWIQVYSQVLEKFGKLNVLVNNAGVTDGGPTTEFSLERWRRVIAVNLEGVFLGIKLAIPLMQKSGSGSIINLSSVAGLVGTPGSAAYCASKGGVRLLTKAIALEYAAFNIRVNSIHPGPVHTPMLEKLKDWQKIPDSIPLHRMAEPRDIANAILFLASDESSFMTGSELVIDGGDTAT